jgi:hypothetical protein
MKFILVTLFILASASFFGQKPNYKLTNALVIGQIDKPEERFALEGALASLLSQNGVKATPSVNYTKVGGDTKILASDSTQMKMKELGFDTYIIANVRGYDRKFKPSANKGQLVDALGQGSLYELYRQDIVSITFEFSFYRNGQFIGSDLVKLGNVSDRESVLRRFNKKIAKRIAKKWKL